MFDTLASGPEVTKFGGEQKGLREELALLASEQSREKRAHTEDARDVRDRLGVDGVLFGA